MVKARIGTSERDGFLMALPRLGCTDLELEFRVGAGEGNRTLMTSLEGCPHILVTGSDLGIRVAAGSRS